VAEPDELERFEARVLPHLDAAYNLALWLTRDADDARDAVQEATLRALRFFAGCRDGDARPWFLKIVRNTVATARGSHRRADVVPFSALDQEDEEPFVESIAAPGDDPEVTLCRLEEQATVDGLLERLPPAFREVLVLRELEDLSYREIADIVQAPIGTVMSRLARARRLLLSWAREREKADEERGT
jgi:RNA polymerase sigma-70 factor, ECF subfamily